MNPKRRFSSSKFAPSYSSSPSSGSGIGQQNEEPKRSLVRGGPSSYPEFVLLLVFHLCKKPLFLPMYNRVALYLSIITIGGLTFDFFRPPSRLLAGISFRPGHVLNMIASSTGDQPFLVKYGWPVTACLLGLFLFLTTKVYAAGRISWLACHVMRLVLLTGLWLLSLIGQEHVRLATGQCYLPTKRTAQRQPVIRSPVACADTGGVWMGFSVSEALFVVALCNLCLFEEVQPLRDWPELGKLFEKVTVVDGVSSSGAQQALPRALHPLSNEELGTTKLQYDRLTRWIRLLAVALCLLSLWWDLVMVGQVVRSQTMPSKLAGLINAYVIWLITYRGWFRWRELSPGLPGEGVIHFVSRRT